MGQGKTLPPTISQKKGETNMQWYETDTGAARLELEYELMKIDFPKMELGFFDDETAVVRGEIGPSDTISKSYHIVAIYPYNYGNGNPIELCTL